MGSKITVTNEMARIVGLVALRHPAHAVKIEWNEGAPEHYWLVTAELGGEEHVYIVDDENGHWAPANADDLKMAGAA